MRRFLKILIIMLLLISNLGVSTIYAAELTDLQEQQTQVQANQDMATTQLQAVKEELTQNLQQVQELNNNIAQYEAEINNYNDQIVNLQNDISKTEEEIKKAEENYKNQKKLLDDRLITMYEAGTTEYLDVVLSSKTITEFLSNYYLLSILADSNVDFLDTIEKQKKIIEDQKKKLEEQKHQVNTSKEEKEKAAIILENTRVMKNTYTSQLTDQEKQIQSEIDAYQTQLNQLEAEIQAITANSLIINPNYIGGEMLWPVPGYTKLSSTFKMRVHPITGVYKLHTGIDIPAPIGTNFLAANEGIVVKASYNSAYGNMVMVDHGGGVSTLYAHGDEIMVTLGQTVKKGDVVLKTGNTGNSTGPHAHFEVRINGTPVDPLPYVTHKDGVN
ncbi:MAG: murein hydrolase activator EnvC family protein [Clostridia bacterium]|jgi:murein DD-endopeptidase MepM/ murein hydrolase activator NlpD|nr:peptidoglycan DD-metalloendopeptidase family protein [Clostridium sp.]HJJ12444.1 peptidoglycan DD-metalloendopeptidase family protein [Clostridiaceae bacterium]